MDNLRDNLREVPEFAIFFSTHSRKGCVVVPSDDAKMMLIGYVCSCGESIFLPFSRIRQDLNLTSEQKERVSKYILNQRVGRIVDLAEQKYSQEVWARATFSSEKKKPCIYESIHDPDFDGSKAGFCIRDGKILRDQCTSCKEFEDIDMFREKKKAEAEEERIANKDW